MWPSRLPRPSGRMRARLPAIPPPVTWARPGRRRARAGHGRPRRGGVGASKVRPRVVLDLEHAPHEREPVRVHPPLTEPDDRVPAPMTEQSVSRLRATSPTHVPAKSSASSRRYRAARPSPADERGARFAADSAAPSTSPRPRRGRCGCGDVVEEEQRIGVHRRGDVADAVRGQVHPACRHPPRCRARTPVPTESVDAASSCSPSSGYSPAKAPNPVAPVDSTAARRRSTTVSAFAIETPAAA